MSTGKYHGAVLTNNEDWEEACVVAGKTSGDLLFPILYCPELHFSEFASAVADMKNSVAVSSWLLSILKLIFNIANSFINFTFFILYFRIETMHNHHVQVSSLPLTLVLIGQVLGFILIWHIQFIV